MSRSKWCPKSPTGRHRTKAEDTWVNDDDTWSGICDDCDCDLYATDVTSLWRKVEYPFGMYVIQELPSYVPMFGSAALIKSHKSATLDSF